ncbi:MAG: CvpA family protein [Candidatus Omnitrophica bacterium]|nr:CvpA family protein [Candidatus Omnitrophota bacterium]
MIIHFLKNIDWVDVGLVFLFVRMVFVGVKNGFLSEFFKSLGTVVAVILAFHYYSFLAVWVSEKTNFSWKYWEVLMFVDIWVLVAVFFKFFGDGMGLLFKAETIHKGFDKYAGGIVAALRSILVCSLAIFSLLLVRHESLTKMTFRSYGFQVLGHTAPKTYDYLFHHLVNKFLAGEEYNTQVNKVLQP